MSDPAFLPYGRQEISDDDIAAVTEVLSSAWLTTGPKVDEFETAFAAYCGAEFGVAVNSGTAALHAAMRALDVGPSDEVIVPAITFVATANAAVYEGAKPIFADVQAETLLIDPDSVATKITPRTRAIIAVDYAGQPADYDALRALAEPRGIAIVADACHAPGATYKGRPVGTLADITAFSFHPVKHLTTAEGGMALTGNGEHAARMRRFRSHGIDSDHRARQSAGTFAYDMVELGYNYRLNDLQCALGLAQLQKLPHWVARRQALAGRYDCQLADLAHIRPLRVMADRTHAYHIYVVRIDGSRSLNARDAAYAALREAGIGVNVHYGAVHLNTYYRSRYGYGPELCPQAEAACAEILTLPLFPAMTNSDVDRVVGALAGLPG
jgi:perosamine synthetase